MLNRSMNGGLVLSVKKFFEVDGKTVEVKKAESRQAVKSKFILPF